MNPEQNKELLNRNAWEEPKVGGVVADKKIIKSRDNRVNVAAKIAKPVG